ncbi:MAG: epoxyqueuosine reductase QueH [Selenomonadaceae bacterium]|nr:epoxyqueuosine reductase QueH [Selenomonadaceae bacterium]
MKLLLHICCGPCACYPVKVLREREIDFDCYFFNPNIHPYMEWQRRLKAAKEFAEQTNVTLITDEHYMLRNFLLKAMQAESAGGSRCAFCYSWRLSEAARYAKENGYDTFSSTLFYSIYQNHELMKKIAEYFAKKEGVEFYYEDFRKGWQEGIDESIERGLYRQPYCGCIFSEEERYSKEIRKRRRKENKAKKCARLEAEMRGNIEN